MPIPTVVNNFSTTLALAHEIGDGVLSMRAGAGDLLRLRLAEVEAPEISPAAPIRMMAAGRKTLQEKVVVPASQWTIFEATGLTGDDLTGCVAVEGTADYRYEVNDPVVASFTVGIIVAIIGEINDLKSRVAVLET
jgi:hypothetical protein